MIFTHADPKDPAFTFSVSGARLFDIIVAEVVIFGRPVLLVHGDLHQKRLSQYTDNSGQPVPNFWRLEVIFVKTFSKKFIVASRKRTFAG